MALELPGGARLLVDGGGSLSPRFDPGRDLAAPALTYNRAPRLDMVCNSHPDLDHMKGLLYILGHFSVGVYLHNAEPPHEQEAHALDVALRDVPTRCLCAGDVLPLPSGQGPPLRLEVLHPPAGPVAGNNGSLVLRLVRGDHGLALLTGDVERGGLRRLLQSGRNLQAEVLVAPHHGSAKSVMAAFYDAVRPSLTLVSCGRHSRYGYPSSALAELLRQRNIPLLTTARHGQIRAVWKNADALRPSEILCNRP